MAAATPRRAFDKRREGLARLNAEILASLDSTSLLHLGKELSDGVNEDTFINLMLQALESHGFLAQHTSQFSIEEHAVALSCLFKSMDLNGNGDLDYNELLEMLMLYGLSGSNGRLAGAYRFDLSTRIGRVGGRRMSKVLLFAAEANELLCFVEGLGRISLLDPESLATQATVLLHRKDINVVISPTPNEVIFGTTSTLELKRLRGSPYVEVGHAIRMASPVTAIGWIPKASIIISGHVNGELKAFRWGRNKGIIERIDCPLELVHTAEVTAICSLGEGCFATGSMDRTVKTWQLIIQKRDEVLFYRVNQSTSLHFHRNGVKCMAYSLRFCMLASAGYDRRLVISNPFSAIKMFTFDGGCGIIGMIFLNVHLITCDEDGVITIWDTSAFTCMQVIRTLKPTTSMAFCSEIDKRMVMAGYSDSLTAYDQRGGSFNSRDQNIAEVAVLTYSPVVLLFITSHAASLRIWNALTGECKEVVVNAMPSSITSMQLDRCSRRLLVGDASGFIKVFNLETTGLLYNLESHSGFEIAAIGNCEETGNFVTLDMTGFTRVHSGEDGSYIVDNRADDRRAEMIRKAGVHEKTCACLSHQGHWAAQGDANGYVLIQELRPSPCVVARRRPHDTAVTACAYIGPLLCTADEVGALVIWRMKMSANVACCPIARINLICPETHNPVIIVRMAPEQATGILWIADAQGWVSGIHVAQIARLDALATIPLPASWSSTRLSESTRRFPVTILATSDLSVQREGSAQVVELTETVRFRGCYDSGVCLLYIIAEPRAIAISRHHSTVVELFSMEGEAIGTLGSRNQPPVDAQAQQQRTMRKRNADRLKEDPWRFQAAFDNMQKNTEQIAQRAVQQIGLDHLGKTFITEATEIDSAATAPPTVKKPMQVTGGLVRLTPLRDLLTPPPQTRSWDRVNAREEQARLVALAEEEAEKLALAKERTCKFLLEPITRGKHMRAATSIGAPGNNPVNNAIDSPPNVKPPFHRRRGTSRLFDFELEHADFLTTPSMRRSSSAALALGDQYLIDMHSEGLLPRKSGRLSAVATRLKHALQFRVQRSQSSMSGKHRLKASVRRLTNALQFSAPE